MAIVEKEEDVVTRGVLLGNDSFETVWKEAEIINPNRNLYQLWFLIFKKRIFQNRNKHKEIGLISYYLYVIKIHSYAIFIIWICHKLSLSPRHS